MDTILAKRGLAAAAVAALAVTGLGAAPAQAEDGAAPEGGIVLMTPFNDGRTVSARPSRFDFFSDPGAEPRLDGVRLAAEIADASAPARFDYHPDPDAADDADGWVEIGQAAVSGGFAELDWFPTTELEGTSVALRVASTTVDGTVTDVLTGVTVAAAVPAEDDTDPTETVDIEDSPFDLGFFVQPYTAEGRTSTLVGVRGSTTAMDGEVELSSWRTDTGEFGGRTSATVDPFGFKHFQGGRYDQVLDITDLDPQTGDTIALGAERETDHVETPEVYEQAIDRIAVGFNTPVPEGRPGQALVTVYDDRDLGVAGAEVRRASDDSLAGYTDASGTVRPTQAGGSTETYYANTTDIDAFEEGVDVRTEPFTFPTYVQQPSAVEAYLADGAVFDRDEAAPGDVGVLVRDQQGAPMTAGTTVEYRLYPSGSDVPATWESATTAENGVAPVEPGAEDADGTYTLDFRLPAGEPADPEDPAPVVPPSGRSGFTVGEADLVLDPAGATQQTGSGGSIVYTGTLRVGDRPLPGRVIDLEYLRGLEYAPGRVPDAGIATGGGLALTHAVTTDPAGRFTVRVRDRADERTPTETGSLRVATGDTVATEESLLAGNAGEEIESGVRFGSGRGSVTIRRGGSGNGARTDVVRAQGPASVAGEQVRVLRVVPQGGRQVVATRTLGSDAGAMARIPDANGERFTTYVVRLVPSERVKAAESAPLKLR